MSPEQKKHAERIFLVDSLVRQLHEAVVEDVVMDDIIGEPMFSGEDGIATMVQGLFEHWMSPIGAGTILDGWRRGRIRAIERVVETAGGDNVVLAAVGINRREDPPVEEVRHAA